MLKKILPGLVVVLITGAGATWYFANYQARNIVDERITALVSSGRYDKLTYDTLNVAPDGSIALTNLLIEQDGVSAIIDTINITHFDYSHEVPWHMTMDLSGFRFPEGLGTLLDEENPVVAAYLNDKLRGETLPLQLQYQYDYTPDNDNQIDASMHLGLPDSFAFTVQSVTRRIALEDLANPDFNNPDLAMNVISTTFGMGELPSVTLTLKDGGLLDTLLQEAAVSGNASLEDFRKLMITQARNLYLFAPQNIQGVAMQAGLQLATFLEGNKTLEIRLNPEFGGNFKQLQPQIMGAVISGDFNAVVELLHLEIEAR